MIDKETILVTGAGGFIGGWIAEWLYLTRATKIRAGIRKWTNAVRLARFPLEIVFCDVLDKASVARALSGATCVVHCVSGSREAIVQGTKNLLTEALKQPVERFVHLSTTEVYGNVNGEIDETAPYQYTGASYGDAKIDAEKLCWEYYDKGLPITILRPSIVYGPFSRDWTVGFAGKLQSRNWGTFQGYGQGICNLIYVTDLVSGILSATSQKRAVGEAFNLVGPDFVTWNQYFQKFNAALGLPELKSIDPASARLRAMVTDPTRALGRFVLDHFNTPLRKLSQEHRSARALLQYTDRTLKTTARISELSLYNRQAIYLTTKARDLLGYQPNFDVDRGLKLTLEWLRNVGLVERAL